MVTQSTRSRRFVGRLDRGADLVAALRQICTAHAIRAGEVRVAGTVENVAFGERTLDGRFDLCTLVARAPKIEPTVTLAAADGSLVGGRLTAARVVACEFVVDAWDDVTLAEEPAPAPPPKSTTWSDVVRASEEQPEPEPPPVEQVEVRAGDFIDHPKFGRVAVERVDSDHEFVTARLRNQRLIRLSLEVLTLIPAGTADGRNLFRAVAGK